MSKKVIIKGTLILTIAGVATKLLGFYNRIFLTRLIGVKELGTYQLIFPIFMLAVSLSCQGIATTLTKHIAKNKNDHVLRKNYYILAVMLSLILALFSGIIIYLLSDKISIIILKNSNCSLLLKAISITLPFISIKSCINAYFIGIDLPGYQGFSHFFEQIIRITSAYIFAYTLLSHSHNALLAVIAVITGEIFASIFSIIAFIKHIVKHKEFNKKTKHCNINKKICFSFLNDAIPITSTNLILMLFSGFEAIIMPAMLFKYYNNSDSAMEMYGIITGIVIPFLLFPSTITTSLSTMILPAVSHAKAINNRSKLTSALKNTIIFCSVLGFGALIFYKLFGEFFCILFFHSNTAGEILKNMCILCPFIYLSGTMSAILNGVDKSLNNLLINIISISIRIFFTITLVPKLGIISYIMGMGISYIFQDILMLITLFNTVKKKKD